MAKNQLSTEISKLPTFFWTWYVLFILTEAFLIAFSKADIRVLGQVLHMPTFIQEYRAKLSDFGLAKDGPEGDKTHVSTRVMGTQGYAAPEYVMTGRALSLDYLQCVL